MVLAIAPCPSVCPSVTSWCCIKTAKWINIAFGIGATLSSSYAVLEVNSSISKNKVASLWNVVTNSELKKYRNCSQPLKVLSTYVDAQCDKLPTVVGRQFITLSVHLCEQHHGRNAERRTDLSAAAKTSSDKWSSAWHEILCISGLQSKRSHHLLCNKQILVADHLWFWQLTWQDLADWVRASFVIELETCKTCPAAILARWTTSSSPSLTQPPSPAQQRTTNLILSLTRPSTSVSLTRPPTSVSLTRPSTSVSSVSTSSLDRVS